MGTRIQIRRDVSTNWSVNNPILAIGEPGLETDTQIVKYGDGVTAWNDLPYSNVDSLADFTTADLAEHASNLYFTNARVYANVDLLDFATNSQIALYATNAQLASYATNAQLGLYATNSQLGSYATNNQLALYATNSQLASYATNAQLGTYATNNQLSLYATNAQQKFNLLTDVSTASLTIDEVAFPAVAKLIVSNSDSVSYRFSSHYGDNNNPNIYVISGLTIAFNLNSSTNPFMLQEDYGLGYVNVNFGLNHVATDGTISSNISAQGKASGTLYWDVPHPTSNSYQYISSVNSSMKGNVVVKNIFAL